MLEVEGLGFRDWKFRDWGLRVGSLGIQMDWGSGIFWGQGLGIEVQALRPRDLGLRIEVLGLGVQGQD